MTLGERRVATDREIEGNRIRFERLARLLHARLSRSVAIDAFGLLLAPLVALFVAAGTGEALPALVASGGLLVLTTLGSWWWLAQPAGRAVLEVLVDHGQRDRRAWRAETGTPLPVNVAAARRWLDEHPDNPGRAAMLVRVGRLEEARRAASEVEVEDEPRTLVKLLLERQIELYAGGRPRSDDLHDQWLRLPAGDRRDQLRWCLAVLDAQIAIVAGRDPTAVLAAARPDAPVLPRSEASWNIRTGLVVHVIAAGASWGLAAFGVFILDR